MCYNAAYSIERNLKHAISREQDPALKKKLEEMLEQWQVHKLPFVPNIEIEDTAYYVNAFEHKHFPVFYLEDGDIQLGFFRWGLVPRWCRDEQKAIQIWNQCINARSETIFDKPSFRASALDRHCVVMLDGFFEYHHQGKKKFPFYIYPTEGPMYVAGLFEKTVIEGEEWQTFTIVTTEGNELMQKIHNNPKKSESYADLASAKSNYAMAGTSSKGRYIGKEVFRNGFLSACTFRFYTRAYSCPIAG